MSVRQCRTCDADDLKGARPETSISAINQTTGAMKIPIRKKTNHRNNPGNHVPAQIIRDAENEILRESFLLEC